MCRWRLSSELVGWILLVLLAPSIAIEGPSSRSVAFHTGSGATRVRLEFAGYPLFERIDSSRITRLAGSQGRPGQWCTYSTSDGLFLTRSIVCSQVGQIPTGLEIAASQLERYEPDAARRRTIAQQLLDCAQAEDKDAIMNWVQQAYDAIDAGQPLPEPSGS